MRVGIIALLHESNTFINQPTTLAHFQQDLLLRGEEGRRLADTLHEVGGFFRGLANAGIDAVPIFAARALPHGPVSAEALERLIAMMAEDLKKAGPVDGLLVAPHGAMVSEHALDTDGYWLTHLRQKVGPDLPIMGTLDPHGNLSPRMVSATDALISYRTNPHVDQRERGEEAANLMALTLKGELRPTQAAAFPPFIINIERQRTAEAHCAEQYEFSDRMRYRPGVLANSLMLGFPYADVPEMGSAVIVVTDRNPAQAQELADDWGNFFWSRRQQFVGRLIDIPAALERAAKLDGPICLLDMGDNVGGGSPGDGTLLAHALLEKPIDDAFVCLFDPYSAQLCIDAGVGATVRLRVGGKIDDRLGPPLESTFEVKHLCDGRFEELQVRHGGIRSFDQGPTAVVQTVHGLTIMLTSRRMAPFSLCQLTSCGVQPEKFHLLVAKGVHAPVAAYQPVCKHFIRVNTPGVTTADLSQLEFHKRRQPMFPFEPDMEWQPRLTAPL
jgi:microcystin degradation protein MlrC